MRLPIRFLLTGTLCLLAGCAAPQAAAPRAEDDPAASLAGRWTVVRLDGAALIGEQLPTVEFEATGRLAGDSGCNHFGGDFRLDGTALSVGPLAATRRACADDALMQREQRLLASLQVANRLTRGRDGSLSLDGPAPHALVLQAAH